MMTLSVKINYFLLRIKLFITILSMLFALMAVLPGCTLTSKNTSIDYRAAGQARLALGQAYLATGELALAHRNLQRAVTYTPNDYHIYLALANYQQRVGEFEQAQTLYEQALRLAPYAPLALIQYGNFLCSQKNYLKANTQFEVALKQTFYDKMAQSFASAGYCYLEQNQLSQAKQLIERAIKHEPPLSNQLLIMANDYLARKQYNKAALLLEIYQRNIAPMADNLPVQIRFASEGDNRDISH